MAVSWNQQSKDILTVLDMNTNLCMTVNSGSFQRVAEQPLICHQTVQIREVKEMRIKGKLNNQNNSKNHTSRNHVDVSHKYMCRSSTTIPNVSKSINRK